MNDDLLRDIVYKYPNHVLQPFDIILDKVGFEGLCILTDEFGGSAIYIPRKKTIFNGCIEQQVKMEYNGSNMRKLCKKYGFCEKTIKNMLWR